MKTEVFIHIRALLQVRSQTPKLLKGKDLSEVQKVEDAYLIRQAGAVVDFGPMSELPEKYKNYITEDLSGRFVFPSFCDSHTHLVFAETREEEWLDRLKGLSYEAIAQKGGGILNSARKLNELDEDTLFQRSKERIIKMMAAGTGAIEIKSGYGLNLEAELKMLRVINRLKKEVPIPIKATFLAAHAVPEPFKGRKDEFIEEVVNEWIPIVGHAGLADFIDVFCERNYFSVDDMQRILTAAKPYGMKAKVHVNQFSTFGAVAAACELGALSVDHLEELSDQDLNDLKDSNTIATLLPACSFYLNIPYAKARDIIESGHSICLASDYNPGSSPVFDLFLIWSMACNKLNLTPEEAFNALTVNAAFSMGLEHSHGSIFKGYTGNLIVTEPAASLSYFPYAMGERHIYKILSSAYE